MAEREKYLEALQDEATRVAEKRSRQKLNPELRLTPEELKIERKARKELMTKLEKFKEFRSHTLLVEVLEDLYSKVGGSK